MGGIATEAVNCSDFGQATLVDSAIEKYIYNGLYVEANELPSIGWAHFALYTWSQNTQSYLETIDAIIVCAIGNGVTGSKYSDLQYVDEIWVPHLKKMQEEVFDTLDLWYNPAFTLASFLPTLVPVLGLPVLWVENIVWYIANLVVSSERSE